jgi:hypothetical protein
LRTAAIPKLSAKGYYETEMTQYVDSRTIRSHLVTLNTDDEDHSEGDLFPPHCFHCFNSSQQPPDDYESLYGSKHIPIFIFSVGGETPIFVDKYYVAKALSDMIIAVQSNVRSYEGRVSCNSNSIYLDLRFLFLSPSLFSEVNPSTETPSVQFSSTLHCC